MTLVRLPALLGAGSDDAALNQLVDRVLNAANRYTLGTWLPATYPGVGPCTPPGPGEHDVRPLGAAALGLAAAVATGMHDPTSTGASWAQATDAAVRLVTGAAGAHKANGGTWGDQWQSPLWAMLAGMSAWLLWPTLTEPQQDAVVRMIEHEANRIAASPPLYWTDRTGKVLYAGDSKSEEDAWNASILALAVVMFPQSPRVGWWTDALTRWGVAASAAPADVGSARVVNGLPLAASAQGWNVTADGYVVNHGRLNPDYVTSAFVTLWGVAAAFGAADALWPSGAGHNLPLVYGSLHRLEFATPPYAAPGGPTYTPGSAALYYPQGQDWGTGMYGDKACADVLAWRLGMGGPNAHGAAVQHLAAVAAQQDRHADGHTYEAGESTYVGREQYVAHIAGLCALALRAPQVTESNADPAKLAAANYARGTTTGENVATLPYAQARGVAAPEGSNQTTYTVPVTFPTGLFDAAPHVQATVVTAVANANLAVTVSDVTPSGCKVTLFNSAGQVFAPTNRRVHWTAVQEVQGVPS